MKKKAALEMSIGTIVIIVLAMTMLIMGLVLIKSIFSGAKYNVDTINDKVKEQINKMFQEDESASVVVYLADSKAIIKKGDDFGVAFAIKNSGTGSAANKFTYEVSLGDDPIDLKNQCGITEKEAMALIIKGRTGEFSIKPGNYGYGLIRIQTDKNSPVCIIRYDIKVKKDGIDDSSTFFDIQIK